MNLSPHKSKPNADDSRSPEHPKSRHLQILETIDKRNMTKTSKWKAAEGERETHLCLGVVQCLKL